MVTLDLSILECFHKFIFLKTRFTKWVTLILVWPCKTFSKGLCSLFSLKIKWYDPYSFLLFKTWVIQPLLKTHFIFKLLQTLFLSFINWPYASKHNIESIWSQIKYSWQCPAINALPWSISNIISPLFLGYALILAVGHYLSDVQSPFPTPTLGTTLKNPNF